MSLRVLLALGRVSNLPTVWTNTLAALALAGIAHPTAVGWGTILLLLLAMSLMYTGGMFLNDAWDAEIDARERPDRPIPAGLVTATEVRNLAFAQFVAALLLLVLAHAALPDDTATSGNATWLLSALALVGTIVLYDRFHKGNPLSPWLMAACRVLVYVTTALLVTGTLPGALQLGALALVLYLAGLTALAKQESRSEPAWQVPAVLLTLPLLYGVSLGMQTPAAWLPLFALAAVVLFAVLLMRRGRPTDGPRAIGLLIAGICLLDALLIAPHASSGMVILALAGFVLTRLLQRRIRGT